MDWWVDLRVSCAPKSEGRLELWTEFLGAAEAGGAARTEDQRARVEPAQPPETVSPTVSGSNYRARAWGRSYAIPKRLESSHILFMGDTGAGKSSAIRQILRQVKERGDTAIVYDPAMDFVGEFYSPERGDLILNPLDARCPYWSLPEEMVAPRSLPLLPPRCCRRRSTRRHSSPTRRAGFWPIFCAGSRRSATCCGG